MENQRFLQRLDMAVLNLSTPFSLSLSLSSVVSDREEKVGWTVIGPEICLN
jgi:hypothetical protein